MAERVTTIFFCKGHTEAARTMGTVYSAGRICRKTSITFWKKKSLFFLINKVRFISEQASQFPILTTARLKQCFTNILNTRLNNKNVST